MAFRKHTKVFTVFSFLRLRSEDIFWYQWIYPTAIAATLIMGFHWFGSQLVTFDAEKLVADINSLMGILVGFYIAALAAVSSFTNENLDQVMKGRAPTLTATRQGQKIKETLTRRRFLAVLFGYCATVAIIVYIFGVLQIQLSVAHPQDESLPTILWLFEHFSWALYTWLLSSLLVATLLSLHYLVERMHRA